MKIAIALFALFSPALHGTFALAQTLASPANVPGKTAETPPVKPGLAPPPWEFHPSCKDAWLMVDQLFKDKAIGSVLKLTKIDCAGTTEAKDELDLHYGRAFELLEAPLSAQKIYEDVALRSTNQPAGQKALELLDLLAQHKIIDEDEMERWVIGIDAKVEPVSAAAMVAYYKWRSFGRRGLKDWSNSQKEKVTEGTTWHLEIMYRDAQKTLAEDHLDASDELFQKIAKDPLTREPTRQLALLQVSRNAFERKDFKGSYEQVQNLNLPVREKGRSLLQMAWSQYYLRDYGKSLGLLEALRTPFFVSSLEPERYKLQMLVLKDLCQYHFVDSVAKSYFQTFAPSYNAIEGRQVLEDEPQLAELVLLNQPIQSRANLVHSFRTERDSANSMLKRENKPLNERLQSYFVQRESTLRFLLKRLIASQMKATSEAMLDQREQIKAIQYTAKIQSLSTERDLSKEFKADAIPRFEFERLYWPVRNEHWWDEMPFYQSQISSRCGQTDTPIRQPAGASTSRSKKKGKSKK